MLRRLRIDVPTALSMLYAPVQPLVRLLHIARRGTRRFAPGDVLLPSGDAGPVGAELERRFGLRHWQFTLSTA